MDRVSVGQLGYVGIGVSDIVAWEKFAANIGLQDNGRDKDGAMFLKMDEHHHRFIVHPKGNDDVSYIGWQVANGPQLKQFAEQLKADGVEIIYGTQEEATKRRVTGLIKLEDPNGIPTEVYYGPEVAYGNDFKSPRANMTGFVTGVMGIGHAVITAQDFDKTMHFYRDILGFRVSDILDGMERRGMKMAFFHCNPRHHSFAFAHSQPREGAPAARMPARKLNHIMIQMNTLDDVGSTYYLLNKEGVPFKANLGRHSNDQMVSFYAQTPSGWGLECGWGGRTVDDATWQVTNVPDDPWGHLFMQPGQSPVMGQQR